MSSEEVKKVSRQDIQLVQNLIERCLQVYMNQKEVTSTLLHQAKIEPGFTELVWQKLEEENQDFFQAYYLRLIVKDQIQRFNDLLHKQLEAIPIYQTGSSAISNGSQIRPMPQNLTRQATEHYGYLGNLPFLYGTESNTVEARPGTGDASGSSFNSGESNSQVLNESVFDVDSTPFGFLGHIPRNFSILESYSGSAFLATDTGNFLEENQGCVASQF